LEPKRLDGIHAEADQTVTPARRPPGRAKRAPVLRAAGKSLLIVASAALAAAATPALFLAAFLAEMGARRRPPRQPGSGAPDHGVMATLIILNFQGRELLQRNLPSVLAAVARSGQPHEVLVVDNGSTDGSVELLRSEFPSVRVLALDRNHFFSAGNNAGVRVASHDIVVLLNNDMRVEPDFLDPLLAPFRDRDDLFAVSSQIVMTDPAKRRQETGLTSGRFAGSVMTI